MRKLVILLAVLIPAMLGGVVGITFSLANGHFTNDGSFYYYEFDAMAQASANGTRLGTGIIFLEYNIPSFGQLVKTNGNVTVTKGALTTTPYMPAYGLILNDNYWNRLAITFEYVPDEAGYGNWLNMTPTQLVHVKMKIQNIEIPLQVCYWPNLMTNQQYYDDNATKYSPVEIGNCLYDEYDPPLPVELSSFTGMMNISNSAVNLSWVTQSETNLLGYNIYRGESSTLADAQNLNVVIAATNTSQTQSYVFSDSAIEPEQTYWYWLEVLELDGVNYTHGPVSITTPGEVGNVPNIPLITGLSALYPNPFNPDLNIDFTLDRDSEVSIVITNIKGQLVKNLVNGSKRRGIHSYKWDGTDSSGRSCASGTYCITMLAGGNVYSRKVVLLK